MTATIKPTVGRKVWFFPGTGPIGNFKLSEQPMDATIIHVWGDTCVNLFVVDHKGGKHFVSSAYLNSNPESRPTYGCWEWMPYRVGQAAKAEKTEKPLDMEALSAAVVSYMVESGMVSEVNDCSCSDWDECPFADLDVDDGLLDFGDALHLLKDGARVTRINWLGNYLYMAGDLVCEYSAHRDECHVWGPLPTDIVAEDWVIVE